MKCFEDVVDLDNQIKRSTNFPEIGTNTGHRFDEENHNWLVMNGFICLSFSYLSFVINDRFKRHEIDNFFDISAFNYVFNRSTPFIDKDYFMSDHELLERVLQKMFQFDHEYLC